MPGTAYQGDGPHRYGRGKLPAYGDSGGGDAGWDARAGRQKFRAAGFDSFGDHRIAMAFAVAALRRGWGIDDR